MRIMALDLGKRRIGIALSDELGVTAQGMPTLNARSQRADIAELSRIAKEKAVSLILVGYPLNMSGVPGAQADWVREYAGSIERNTGITVKLWDERLTSAAANRALREGNARPDRKSGTVDRMAATILLQSYLDSLTTA